MEFVDQHKYQDNERAIFKFVKGYNPNTIVELGYGSGALTIAMAYGSHDTCKIYSYDLRNSDLAIQRLSERNLLNKCNLIEGDIYDTYLNNLITFDLILIDIDNTWSIIFDITINNKFINNRIKQGAAVIIEGGADLHPRINKNTLTDFHNMLGKEVFAFNHLSGQRTSLSTLNLL
jgi:predicted O-methyltransferase YrrM